MIGLRGQPPGIRLPFILGGFGFGVSLIWCVLYGRFGTRLNAHLDPDAFGALGVSLWQGFGLTFEPNGLPALIRGPGYPAFLALSLAVFRGWFPEGIWISQSILHGLTTGLVSLCALRLFSTNGGVLAGLICAASPATIWYTPRIWSETLLASLLMLLFVTLVTSASKWSTRRSVTTGALVGVLSLTKGVFLPLILAVPLILLLRRVRVSLYRLVLIPGIAVMVVLPWTVRNFVVSGGIVPVHTGLYFNTKVGNIYAERWLEHPFFYSAIWYEHVVPLIQEVSSRVEPGPPGALHKERIYRSLTVDDFASDPLLVLKKIVVAGTMFWTVGDTPLKSLFNSVTRLSILFLAVIGLRHKWGDCFAAKVSLTLVGVYYVCHLLVGPPARLSTPIMPILTIWATAGLFVVFRTISEDHFRAHSGDD